MLQNLVCLRILNSFSLMQEIRSASLERALQQIYNRKLELNSFLNLCIIGIYGQKKLSMNTKDGDSSSETWKRWSWRNWIKQMRKIKHLQDPRNLKFQRTNRKRLNRMNLMSFWAVSKYLLVKFRLVMKIRAILKLLMKNWDYQRQNFLNRHAKLQKLVEMWL